MKSVHAALAAALTLAVFAPPALASDGGALEARVAQVERQLANESAPSAREIQSSVDAYLASGRADASLVGGPGQAGYDGGFWIRGGTFLLKINLTLQARYEYFDWDDKDAEPSPGGDLSGFSLPRATLKLSGDATCDVHYYAELEFGHHGSFTDNSNAEFSLNGEIAKAEGTTEEQFFGDAPILREAWIEYEAAPAFAFRMGIVRTAATRQLMTAPELQQFADISLASSFIGMTMPGWYSRNYDYGFMLHGALGCDGQISYMVTVTNGDGIERRNVLDGTTSDNLAYSARLNWDIVGHMGYEEGALRQTDCGWVASVGAWAHYYSDARQHNPFEKFADRLTWGVDAAVGFGGFSFTGAYSVMDWNADGSDVTASAWLLQVGYLFPGTAWEIAARWSAYTGDDELDDVGAYEYAAAVTYYVDGHADKITADVAWVTAEDLHVVADTYPGWNVTGESDGLLVRLQWQLAL
jgi:hypothetical protein